MKYMLALFALAAIFAVVGFLAGCAAAKAEEAEATYLGQQLRCVDQYATRPDIDSCRRKVRAAWGITETARDGGDQ